MQVATELKIKEGDRILAGQTIAVFTPMSSLSISEKIIEGPKRVLSKLKATALEKEDGEKNITNIIYNIRDSVINRSKIGPETKKKK